ncbi:SMODS domain-containing nucleotidyltransferase [Lolliginicoccus suaedae]|uniref:SMODS domain-containing nucleotidyltransferase n=1 Tax=Lolliginicoccus suaedae TaxID=2605429 RepID=UPI0011EBAE6E|nr:nucleotidyltransferase [Lolliginicoccus suaedae]
MDTNAHFEAFLDKTVNLKPWKLTQLDDRVNAIVNALQRDPTIGPMYKEHLPQGSWAHHTIINPVGEFDEFDADFLLHVEENLDWSDDPGQYLREVRAAFKRTATYKDKVRKKNRCIRIGYANESHVDVVPNLTLADGRQVIVNYRDNCFEDTNPDGFTQWMHERDELAGGNLRRVIRLLKYLRDYKNTFDCKSVILTTLVGGRVQPFDVADRYADIPTTLVTLLEDLDSYLDLHEMMPLLDDPSCPGTSFNHRWGEEKYSTFKTMIKKYARWACEARDATTEAGAVAAWQKLFGPEFVTPEVTEAKAAIVATARSCRPALDVRAPGEEFIEEQGYRFQPRYTATIDGRVMELNGGRARTLRDRKPVRRGLRLRFTVKTDAPHPYRVIWKVRNRGDPATAAADLRGALIAPNQAGDARFESTKYRGRHYIEVYIVREEVVVASDHHEVIIQ